LFDAVTGIENTAVGSLALPSNTNALESNTTGSANTASGSGALGGNTIGGNTIGSSNTAIGVYSLLANTTGGQNTAAGVYALSSNTTGSFNTSIGDNALFNNASGINNIAVGYNAAFNVSRGNSYNIHIGSRGSSGDNTTIRLGTPGTQISFFVAGVRGVTRGNSDAGPVVIDSNGQFGTLSSSRRFKGDMEDMGASSHNLMRLRPVTFRYKQPFVDGFKPIQYGLIAEEVAQVYLDLVAHQLRQMMERPPQES
jgi:hypothetical protein